MSTIPYLNPLFTQHTFGRSHVEPPPLPASMQQGQAHPVEQMGEATTPSLQMYAGELPHDFDHIVRSVGEW